MIELFKVSCGARGCDSAAGRVVREGERLELEVFEVRHHGREHPRIDLRALFAKLKREGIGDKDSREP